MEASGKSKRKEGEEAEELENELNPARNYPRKRVAVACEVCRLRKTKCDAKRPCSFCTEAGIECVYRGQNSPQTQSAASDILARIEDRLARLEDFLNPSKADTVSTPGSIGRQQSIENHSLPSRARNPLVDERRNYHQQSVATTYNFSFRQTAGEAVTPRPSLTSFQSPFYLQFESWDDTERFYDDELTAEEHMYETIEAYHSQPLNLTPRDAWKLQQTFVTTFLQWMPLLDLEHFVEHVRIAAARDFSENNRSNCLTMFAFAIAMVSQDQETKFHDPIQMEFLPGLDYFSRGCQILQRLTPRSRRDIDILQCRLLQGCYFQFAIRPLLGWDTITELARDLMHKAILKTQPTGLRQFHEVVPLPLTDNEEEGFYYFFAQASLRRLLTETLDVVGYRVGQVIYAPVVTAELRKQASEWYDHLPPAIKFPINSSPLFDFRKAFLRIQYVALHTVILWPSLLKFLENLAPRNSDHAPMSESQLRSAEKEARDCLDYVVLVCDQAEEVLMRRHLGLQMCLYVIYANLCMLLVTYKVHGLGFIPHTRSDTHIRKVFNVMRGWEHLSIVRRALERTRAQMQRAQIPTDDYIAQSPSDIMIFDSHRGMT
ncbi:hypothetical protein M501DRAFT_991269 [Patellaria atrata CBS 101060]|uniref:Zn(2)-C6 fungal-type domain-containing protein n=1 Tax=Patellaria atrata CBS 101060 TaxID=1346257 RepID=A0A9P4VSV2_9PEZI|nr:hypothetical protein M501DRAFT_991269 [Patellaria atrata CBS 101060]